MLLFVTPNLAADHTLTIPNFVPDLIHRPTAQSLVAGGKGVNAARAARFLGAEVLCAGFVAGHIGRLVEQSAREEGIEGIWTRIEGETRICSIIVDPALGTATVINTAGPSTTAENWEHLHNDVIRLAEVADTICFCGSLPAGSPLDSYSKLITALVNMDKHVWIDCSGAPLRAAMAVKGISIKVNTEELSDIVGRPLEDLRSALEAGQELLTRGIKAVALTMGKRGAVLINSHGHWIAIPPQITAISAVGSGDSFLAGLLYNPNLTDAEALRHGVAAGTANALTAGGGRFTREHFDDILGKITTE